MIIVCTYCGDMANKRTGDVNRSNKKGVPLFCSKKCTGLARRKDNYVNEKECNTCCVTKKIESFRIRVIRGYEYTVARCKQCESKISKSQVNLDNKRKTDRVRNSIPENRKRKNKLQRDWRAKNIEKNRAYHRKNIKKNVDGLSDNYISRLMDPEHLAKGEIPPPLIKLKRLNLICKRTLKIIKQ